MIKLLFKFLLIFTILIPNTAYGASVNNETTLDNSQIVTDTKEQIITKHSFEAGSIENEFDLISNGNYKWISKSYSIDGELIATETLYITTKKDFSADTFVNAYNLFLNDLENTKSVERFEEYFSELFTFNKNDQNMGMGTKALPLTLPLAQYAIYGISALLAYIAAQPLGDYLDLTYRNLASNNLQGIQRSSSQTGYLSYEDLVPDIVTDAYTTDSAINHVSEYSLTKLFTYLKNGDNRFSNLEVFTQGRQWYKGAKKSYMVVFDIRGDYVVDWDKNLSHGVVKDRVRPTYQSYSATGYTVYLAYGKDLSGKNKIFHAHLVPTMYRNVETDFNRVRYGHNIQIYPHHESDSYYAGPKNSSEFFSYDNKRKLLRSKRNVIFRTGSIVK